MTTSEKVLTFSAIFISCLALVVSIAQTRILQQQSYAAVWPRLSVGQGVGPDYYICSVTNDGVGPALLTSVKYTHKDTSFQLIDKLFHYFGKLEIESTKEPLNLNFKYSNVAAGYVIADGDEVELYEAGDSINLQLGNKYFSEVIIEMKYCSIYEDCWMIIDDETIEL